MRDRPRPGGSDGPGRGGPGRGGPGRGGFGRPRPSGEGPRPGPRPPAQNFRREIRLMVAHTPEGMTTEEICKRLNVSPQRIGDDIEVLVKNDNLIGFAGLWYAPATYLELAKKFVDAMLDVHAKSPNQPGIRRESVASRAELPWKGKTLDRVVADLAKRKMIEVHDGLLRHPQFEPQLPPRQRELLDRVKEELEKEVINVVSPHEIARMFGVPHQAITSIMDVGVASGELVHVAENVFYTTAQLDAAVELIKNTMRGHAFTAGELREKLQTTRKYVPPLLEHLESVDRISRRDDHWHFQRD